MNGMDLLRLIGEIDDKHIELSLEEVRKSERRTLAKWTSVAACAALVIGAGTGVYFSQSPSAPVVPAPLTASTTKASTVIPPIALRYPDENEKCSFNNAYSWDNTLYYDYAELAEKSDMVVVVDVISTDRFKGKLYYIPCANVAVCEVIKGDAYLNGEILRVRDNGTSLYSEELDSWVSQTECGGPLMERGNRLLMFLSKGVYKIPGIEEEYYQFSTSSISKFFYGRDGKYHSSATYCEQFETNYMTASMLEDYTPKTLDEIKRLIQTD